jgi:hypothetical protein
MEGSDLIFKDILWTENVSRKCEEFFNRRIRMVSAGQPATQPPSQGEQVPLFVPSPFFLSEASFGGHIMPENLLDLNFGDTIPGFPMVPVSSSTSVFGLLYGVQVGQEVVSTTELLLQRHVVPFLHRNGGRKEKSLAKKPNNKHPCITINNNRWCQDSKLYLFIYLIYNKVTDLN